MEQTLSLAQQPKRINRSPFQVDKIGQRSDFLADKEERAKIQKGLELWKMENNLLLRMDQLQPEQQEMDDIQVACSKQETAKMDNPGHSSQMN